ncbi:MAG: anthranilate synthase component I family protein, partial [Ilumatobacteraceae bacterium]
MRISPPRDEFRALAATYGVVPVWTEVLADRHTPVGVFLALVGDQPGFLLESVEHGERWARFSFVGCRPRAEIASVDGKVRVSGAVPASVPRDKVFLAALEAMLAAHRAPVMPELPPLQGGMIGHVGYDIVREIEHLPDAPKDDRNIPDAIVSMIGSLAAFDHWRQRAFLIESVPTLGLSAEQIDAAYDAAIVAVQRMANDLSRAAPSDAIEPPIAGETPSALTSSLPDGRYQDAVRVAKEHILAGDIFQVVLSQRFETQLDADPFDFYRVLRQVNPSPYMYYVKHDALTIAGSSPEPLVQVRDGKVVSRPIAGTRKRGRDDEHDRKLAGELRENPKERAEHVMLVDLARNDVGRVAKFGTVKVDEFMTLERYSHVMHLTSQVSGELREGLGPIDVLRATLPAGTV